MGFLVGLAQALVPALLMNVAIVGLVSGTEDLC